MWNKGHMTPLCEGCVADRDFRRIFAYHAAGELFLDELVPKSYRLG
jgi:hypothetical protein